MQLADHGRASVHLARRAGTRWVGRISSEGRQSVGPLAMEAVQRVAVMRRDSLLVKRPHMELSRLEVSQLM